MCPGFFCFAYRHPPHSSSQAGLPRSWRQYQHPIGDIYFHNHNLHLTTAENVRHPDTLRYILEARDDHIQCVAGDPHRNRLPPDIELVISDVSDATAVIRMYSRMAATVYDYSEETGSPFFATVHAALTSVFLRSASRFEGGILVPYSGISIASPGSAPQRGIKFRAVPQER